VPNATTAAAAVVVAVVAVDDVLVIDVPFAVAN
jgi:hypothetical protein